MRPDTTVPIARMTASRLKNASFPLRIFYCQNIYTVNAQHTGKSDETTQVGIELIGSSSCLSDMEMIATAAECLYVCAGKSGNKVYSLELGDAGFFKELVKPLELISSETKEEMRSLMHSKNYPALDTLIAKQGIKIEPKTANALRQLPRLFGGVEVFDKAREALKGTNQRCIEMLTHLENVFHGISQIARQGSIAVDMGLVGRTDYYTGIIVKGYIGGHGNEVLSGGRYDKLLGEFGAEHPATGFALDLSAICKIKSRNISTQRAKTDVLIFAEQGCEVLAVKTADKHRENGKIVELALLENIEDTRQYAKENGITEIIIVKNE
jgi:ATP phosphoribosyltransferase regulatory subunit